MSTRCILFSIKTPAITIKINYANRWSLSDIALVANEPTRKCFNLYAMLCRAVSRNDFINLIFASGWKEKNQNENCQWIRWNLWLECSLGGVRKFWQNKNIQTRIHNNSSTLCLNRSFINCHQNDFEIVKSPKPDVTSKHPPHTSQFMFIDFSDREILRCSFGATNKVLRRN